MFGQMVLKAHADRVRGIGIGIGMVVMSSGVECKQRGIAQPRFNLRLVQDGVGAERVVDSRDDPATVGGRMGVRLNDGNRAVGSLRQSRRSGTEVSSRGIVVARPAHTNHRRRM